MTDQVLIAAVSLAGIALTALGAIIGSAIAARAQRRVAGIAASAASQAAKKTAEESLIDQLQEELARYRERTDQRLERLERENQEYRKFIFVQRDHMLQQGVTPPPWPDTLPR